MYYFRRNPRIVSTTARINTTIVTAAAITKKIAEKTGIPWPPCPPEKIIKSSRIPIHTKKILTKSCPGISSSHNSEEPLFRFILSYPFPFTASDRSVCPSISTVRQIRSRAPRKSHRHFSLHSRFYRYGCPYAEGSGPAYNP